MLGEAPGRSHTKKAVSGRRGGVDCLQKEHTGQRQGGRKLGGCPERICWLQSLCSRSSPMTMSGVSFLNLAPPVPSSIRCLSCGVTFSPISTALLTYPLHLLTQNFCFWRQRSAPLTPLYANWHSSWHEAGAQRLSGRP